MNKTQAFLTFAILINCFAEINAQFYTVLPKKEEAVELKKQTSEEETINFTSTLAKETISEKDKREQHSFLSTLNQRQYLSLPIDTLVVTSGYGYRADPFDGRKKFHKGIDLRANYHYIYSIMPGKVIKSGRNKALGIFVQIDHGDFKSIYGHLSISLAPKNDIVHAGQPIGVSGSSGRSTGEHLHFQMSYKNKTIDPQPILDFIQKITTKTRNDMKLINN